METYRVTAIEFSLEDDEDLTKYEAIRINEILEEKKKEREARKQQMNNLQDVGEGIVREEIDEETQEVS